MPEQAPAAAPVQAATGALADAILAAVAEAGGALPFDQFMAMALYQPGLGYYARPDRLRVGRGGDFITSVSVGRCFGMLLARHLAPRLEAMAEGGGGELTVAEAGAEGGELAVDLMAELGEILPAEVSGRLTYVGVEPFPAKRAPLERALREGGAGRSRVVAGWGELSGARGCLVANELLDALPVKRFRACGGAWRELCVGERDGGLAEVDRATDDPPLSPSPADGHTLELCPGLGPWFSEVAGAFDELHACVIDYGLAHSAEFLDPGRRDGTLRAYREHKLVDPLSAPGETDLTAHVDFERAGAAARAAGLEVFGLTDQHRFLVGAARPWLLEIERCGTAPDAETAKLLRQFQSLSHPAAMGMAFKVLEVGKRVAPK